MPGVISEHTGPGVNLEHQQVRLLTKASFILSLFKWSLRITFFYILFWKQESSFCNTNWCSGVTLGSVLRNHSGRAGNHVGACGSAACKATPCPLYHHSGSTELFLKEETTRPGDSTTGLACVVHAEAQKPSSNTSTERDPSTAKCCRKTESFSNKKL